MTLFKQAFYRLSVYVKLVVFAGVLFGAAALVYVLLPKPDLYAYKSYSVALFDRNDQLLRITLASDDRYRIYTPLNDIANTFQQATILYEDQHFYEHSGVDFSALVRAFWQTYVRKERRIGASTIVMQVARLRWQIDSSTLAGKAQQIGRALQLSRHYSKATLLEAYLNLAPYGGNIEGIGAASLIYFNKPASELSIAEGLTLAVVPQNPSKRNPAKDSSAQAIDDAKKRLWQRWLALYPSQTIGGISSQSVLELPLLVTKPQDLPYLSPHFVQYVLTQPRSAFIQNDNNPHAQRDTWNVYKGNSQLIKTTLDIALNTRLENVLQSYIKQHASQGFSNASALLLNHKTMHIEAMIGSADFNNVAIQGQVNGTLAKRSPGSTLKPFVYGLALDAGLIHPMTMLKDLPKKYAGFAPENFGRGFVGPISAQDALIKSRNVPAVDLQYQLSQLNEQANHNLHHQALTFYDFLKRAGVSQLKSPSFYGLALALGGGEVSMLELVELYAIIANLGEYKNAISHYSQPASKPSSNQQLLSPEAAFLLFDMLSKNPAPNATSTMFSTPEPRKSEKVAWKTGTSWAFRDAWAIGISGDYILAVWIGNFSGAGNNAFIGRSAAGPLLFSLLNVLPKPQNLTAQAEPPRFASYEKTPFDQDKLQDLNLTMVNICQTTGDLYTPTCPQKTTTLFIPGVSPIKSSNIYRKIWVDEVTGLRQCDNRALGARQKVFAFWPSDFQTLFEQAGVFIEKPPKFAPQCSMNSLALLGYAPIISSPQPNLSYMVQHSSVQGIAVQGIAVQGSAVQDSLENTASIVLKASADAEASYLYWFANEHFITSVDLSNAGGQEPPIWQARPGQYNMQVSDDLGRSASVVINVQAVQ